MTTRPTHLDRERVRELLEEARELVGQYNWENEIHPKTPYRYGSVDRVALRLLEGREGFVTVGVTLRGDNVNLHGRVGHLDSSGIVCAEPATVTYVLRDFTGTTVARFVRSICDVLSERALNGNNDLRALMVPNVAAYARRTKEEVAQYGR